MQAAPVGDQARLGAVHLRVTDLDRLVAVWRDVIGLEIIRVHGQSVELGHAAQVLLVLHSGASSPVRGPSVGLFHVAIEVPTRDGLAQVANRMVHSGLTSVGQDHLVTHSIYLTDPDGMDIEVLLSTPDRGRIEIAGGFPRALPADGSAHNGREAFDIQALAEEARGRPPTYGARMHHLHLRSRAPERLLQFYCDVVGFLPFVNAPAIGMFDVGTAVSPHVLAFNNWGGPAIRERVEGSAGLMSFEIVVPSGEHLAALQARLSANNALIESGAGTLYEDPDGNFFRVSVAA